MIPLTCRLQAVFPPGQGKDVAVKTGSHGANRSRGAMPLPGPTVPLSLMSKTSKVGKALASAAKPVTDSLCTSESLLSKRIEAIERLGDLQFVINGYIVAGEATSISKKSLMT